MPRRVWRSLDGPYVAPRPGDTVDLRGTTRAGVAEERKEILLSSYYSGVGSYFGGYSSVTTAPGRPWTFDRGIREGYARVPWVHAAVRVIAVSQAGLRFGVKDKPLPVGEGAVELKDDPLLPVLNVRANPVEYATQLRQRVSTQWMLSPRGGFIERVPPARGSQKRTVEIRLLPPARTRIVPDKGGNIDHFEVDPVGGIGKPRPVAPEMVRWFREPHPSDPFAGLTPLEAAGLSIEMDYFARLFNRQFMANDGRPGGIVAVTSPDGKGEPADDAELDRVERKFGGGPVDAGRLVVLDGTVQYVDVTKSARDMQWKDAGVQSRNEIFGVFLVPVSAVDASGRTFSNAGQEWINYWTLMGVPHGDAFAQLFSDDVEGIPFLDYSKVAALEEVKQTKRAEWRDEVEQGLRTPLRYAKDTGQQVGDQPGDFPDVPATRSLWLPAGKVPVALNDDDQVDVEKLAPLGSATQAAPMRGDAAGGGIDGGSPDAGGGDGGGGIDGGGPDGGGGWPDGGGGDSQFKAARDRNLTRLATRRAGRERALRAVGSSPLHDDEDKEDDRARPVEAALTAALTAVAQRQVAVSLARARGVKARMGTRHWAPKPGDAWSTKELDAAQVVDPQQWSDQAADAARTNLAPLVQQQYDATRAQAEADGGADVAAVLGPVVAGAAALLLAHEVEQLVTWVATSAANHGAELLAAVGEAERGDAARVAGGGQPRGIEPVTDAIGAWAQRIPGWVQQVVPTSVAQAVEAGKHAVLSPLGDRVQREWRTKRDDRVRDAHKDAEGQLAAGGDPFLVGGENLRYPRDPLGSPGNVINCRCRTRWRLAARSQSKALAVGQNVVADVLALPVRASAGRADRTSVETPAPVHGATFLRPGDRVLATGALEGVAARDHVAEMLTKDIVRTAAGEHEFHLPIGSPIGHGGGDWQATRVLKVHDSRDLVEQGDRFVRVPGTGDLRQCDRCGKGHEVHVTVEDQHGATHTVGTACARATGPAAARLKSVTSATATADRLEAQAAKAEAYQAQRRAALEQVRATLQMPAHTESPSKLGSGTDFTLPDGEGYQRVAHADGRVPTDTERDYALRQLRDKWEQRRVDEAVPRDHALDYADVDEMKRKAAKARKKATDLLDQPSAEGKSRHVRTAAGVDEFHLPIGSPIGGRLDAPHVRPHSPAREDVDNLFGGEFAGFRTTVATYMRYDDGTIRVTGTIHAGTAAGGAGRAFNEADDVGEFRRIFNPDTGHVEHAWLKLDDEAQGLGFATAFNTAAERQYEAWGYRQIDVEAGDQAGGIVWAKAGFLFEDGGPPEDVVDALDYAQMQGKYGAWNPETGGTDHLKMGSAESKALETMIGRARGGSEVTPAEVIACGPVAQAVMREYGWNGYKPIGGTKSAQGDVMRVRIRGVHPLAGTARRDHVAEMLAPSTESKVRRVRTEGGVRRFHEPVGAPIVAHPGLGGLGGRDHAGAVAADAARTRPVPVPDTRGALANLLANRTIEGGVLHPPSGGPSPHFPGGNDHGHGGELSDARDHANAVLKSNVDPEGVRSAECHDAVIGAWTWLHQHGITDTVIRSRGSHSWIEANIGGEPHVVDVVAPAQVHLGDPVKLKVDATHALYTGPGVKTFDSLDAYTADPATATNLEPDANGKTFHDASAQVAAALDDEAAGALDKLAQVTAPAATGGGATGDMAKAKAELAGKGQDVAGLMAGGMDAQAATKEYARLLHNARFRYRRDRLKAEKKAGGKVAKSVAADVAQGPKKVTLASVGQQLLDDPESVKLDKALVAETGVQPKALYSVPHGSGADTGATPGGVEPGERWYDKLTADTTEPIPVAGLNFGGGYVVQHGLAMRRDGVSFLVEMPSAPGSDPGSDAVAADRLARTHAVYKAFLATVPEERRGMQRGVALINGRNPADAMWAKRFNEPGFTSAATGGMGGTTYWNANDAHPGLAAHEYGHNLDSGVHLPGAWLSDSGPVLEGQGSAWGAAAGDDAEVRKGLAYAGIRTGPDGTFVETRPDPSHPIRLDADATAPTTYAMHNAHEDFAESVRLYLKDRREGKLGYVKPTAGQTLGTNVRFADLWPERSKVLDAAFGVQTDYDTAWAKQQRAKATAGILDRLHAVHEAEQQQGFVPASLTVEDVQRQFGLSIRNAVAAYGAAQDQYAKDLAGKNEQDALEHVKEQLAGQADTPDSGQVAELVADLMDGFGLEEDKGDEIVAAAVGWHGQQLEAQKQKAAETAAKLAAETALQDVLSLEDLPKETQTVIRKRRANVKLRAKQKGATAEQAEAIAAAYEADQVAKEAAKLGLSGQVVGKEIVKGKVAAEVHAQAAGPEVRIKPGGTGGSKGSATWLSKAGAAAHPKAKQKNPYGGTYGKPAQAKSNIAASLAESLNNPDDWETFRAYRNSGAHRGTGTQFHLPTAKLGPGVADTHVDLVIEPFDSYTPEQRQSILDGEVSQRVSTWASTSGDSNPFAVMMQQAVKDELGVPGPVGVNDGGGQTQQAVDKRYPHVAAFYRRFVRVQYEDTQRQLAADGIEWVVLYRGMKVDRGAHDWANDTDDGHVPLQPVSSFSTAPAVSARFAGHTPSSRMMARGVVHRSQILGSARTGFGCLNEKEYAVLAPAGEDAGRFQVRYVVGSKAADLKAAFDKPPRLAPTMTRSAAVAALKDALGSQPLSPSVLLPLVRATPATSATVAYQVGGTVVDLPRDAAVAWLEHSGYTI